MAGTTWHCPIFCCSTRASRRCFAALAMSGFLSRKIGIVTFCRGTASSRTAGFLVSPCRRKIEKPAKDAGLVVAPSGLELFSHYAYNQSYTEVRFLQVPKSTPLCVHLLLQS